MRTLQHKIWRRFQTAKQLLVYAVSFLVSKVPHDWLASFIICLPLIKHAADSVQENKHGEKLKSMQFLRRPAPPPQDETAKKAISLQLRFISFYLRFGGVSRCIGKGPTICQEWVILMLISCGLYPCSNLVLWIAQTIDFLMLFSN